MAGAAKNPVTIEEMDGGAALVIRSRNGLVTALATLVLGLPVLAFVTLAVIGLTEGRPVPSLLFLICAVGLVALIWRLGWQPKARRILFRPSGVEAGPHRFAYAEIDSFGIDRFGGTAWDPATMPIPRNTVTGAHVYVQHRGRRTPVTVGLSATQARAARDAFGALMARYGGRDARDA